MRSRSLPHLERLGVELIEQPFPARRLDQLRWLQERSSTADRCRRELRLHRGSRRSRGGRRRRQREAREVRRDRAGQADARASARAGLPDIPRLHGGDAGRASPVRRSSRRSPTGWTSTAACCWRTTRSKAWNWGRTTAGGCRPRPVSGCQGGPPDLDPRSYRTGVRRTGVRVDKLVDEVVDKPPSRSVGAGLRWSATPVEEPAREDDRSAQGPTSGHRSRIDRMAGPGIVLSSRAAGPPSRTSRRCGGRTPHRWSRGPPPVNSRTRRRSSSSASATSAVGWGGRSCMTRCVRSPHAGSIAATGRTTWRPSGSASASSRCRRWPRCRRGVVAEEQARRRPVSVTIRADVPAPRRPRPT